LSNVFSRPLGINEVLDSTRSWIGQQPHDLVVFMHDDSTDQRAFVGSDDLRPELLVDDL
jgi:hypothetical protein